MLKKLEISKFRLFIYLFIMFMYISNIMQKHYIGDFLKIVQIVTQKIADIYTQKY